MMSQIVVYYYPFAELQIINDSFIYLSFFLSKLPFWSDKTKMWPDSLGSHLCVLNENGAW